MLWETIDNHGPSCYTLIFSLVLTRIEVHAALQLRCLQLTCKPNVEECSRTVHYSLIFSDVVLGQSTI